MFSRYHIYLYHHRFFGHFWFYRKHSLQEVWITHPTPAMAEIETFYHSGHCDSYFNITTFRWMCCAALHGPQQSSLWVSDFVYHRQFHSMASVSPFDLFGTQCSLTFDSSSWPWNDSAHFLDVGICRSEFSLSEHEEWRLVVWSDHHCRLYWVFPFHCEVCHDLRSFSSRTESPRPIHNWEIVPRRTYLSGNYKFTSNWIDFESLQHHLFFNHDILLHYSHGLCLLKKGKIAIRIQHLRHGAIFVRKWQLFYHSCGQRNLYLFKFASSSVSFFSQLDEWWTFMFPFYINYWV